MAAANPLSVPAPPFVIEIVSVPGSAPPWVASKILLVLERAIVGVAGGGATVKVTMTICGLLLAAAEVTETLAL
jgi:hypothetical protein